MAINIRIPVALLFLLSILYFSIHHAVQNTPPPISFPLDRIEADGSIAQFGFEDLEVIIKGMLERARSGKSISYKEEKMLKEAKAILAIYSGANSELVAKLIAMINEILELNRELIHLEDGEHSTDDN